MASRQAANKSRIEKGRGGASAATPVVHDIIPGKFNDLDWQQALGVEETDTFVGGLVQSVADTCCETIYKNYLEKQLIPFTVSMAKDAIVQLVEWTFIQPDRGEPDILLDDSWQEELEPETYAVDSWAQGAIPKRPSDFHAPRSASVASARLAHIQEEVAATPQPLPSAECVSPVMEDTLPEEPAAQPKTEVRWNLDDESEGLQKEGDEGELTEEEQRLRDTEQAEEAQPVEDSYEAEPPQQQQEEEALQVPKPPTIKKKEPFIPGWSQRPRPVRFKPYAGRITSAGLKDLEETLEQTEKRLMEEDKRRERELLLKLQQEREAARAARAAMKDSLMFTVQTNEDGQSSHRTSQSYTTEEDATLASDSKRGPGKPDGVQQQQQQTQANAFGKRPPALLSRLNPDQLPQHKVKINYRVVDADADAFNARLEAIKKGRPFTEAGSGTPLATGKKGTAGSINSQTKGNAVGRYTDKLPPLNQQPAGKRDDPLIDPLPNTMIDTINLAPGVVAKQAGRVRRGPKQNDGANLLPDPTANSLKAVRPLQPDAAAQVKAVIDESNITLRPSLEIPATGPGDGRNAK